MNSLQARTPNEIAFLADTNTHAFRFDIPSSDGKKSYRVSTRKATGSWECSCPAWIYQRAPLAARQPCKHLKAMSDLLLQIEGKAAPAAVAAAPTSTAPRVAPAPKRIAANGAQAARQAIDALVAQAEAEAAQARADLERAEAKLAALKVAAKAAA